MHAMTAQPKKYISLLWMLSCAVQESLRGTAQESWRYTPFQRSSNPDPIHVGSDLLNPPILSERSSVWESLCKTPYGRENVLIKCRYKRTFTSTYLSNFSILSNCRPEKPLRVDLSTYFINCSIQEAFTGRLKAQFYRLFGQKGPCGST